MDKYINANKLEKDGWSMQRIRKASPTEMVYETKKPTDFPAADVIEMRCGKWRYKPAPPNALFGFYVCSECGAVSYASASRYCPDCGAKMTREEEEMSKVSEMEMAYGEYLNG